MKLHAILSITALISSSTSAAPLVDSSHASETETSALHPRDTRVPIKGIICNPQDFPGADQYEYSGVMTNLNKMGVSYSEDVAPGRCPKRTSWLNAAVHICNDNAIPKSITNGDIREIMGEIYKACSATKLRYSGQAFTTEGWNVILRGIE